MAKPRLAHPSIHIPKSLHNGISRHSEGYTPSVRHTLTDVHAKTSSRARVTEHTYDTRSVSLSKKDKRYYNLHTNNILRRSLLRRTRHAPRAAHDTATLTPTRRPPTSILNT